MKIIDTTTFFEENMMMDIRFNILNPYVDKFIVCESLYTHSGKKKNINFNVNNYPKFKNKIVHLILENQPVDLHGSLFPPLHHFQRLTGTRGGEAITSVDKAFRAARGRIGTTSASMTCAIRSRHG